MKANEMPERVYLFDYNNAMVTPLEGDTVYVREDSFIEKAVKFMEKIDDVDEYSWYNEEEHTAGITEKCIEDFKKHMEG